MQREIRNPLWAALLIAGLVMVTALGWRPGEAQEAEGDAPALTETMRALLADRQPVEDRPAQSVTLCEGGLADIYPCENIDLLAFMPLISIGGGTGNDSWGWTDPVTGKEYALMGRSNGTGFIDISDPANPVYIGNLATHTSSSTWRDIKVYADHAFIVSEASGHGMQVFDLTELRDVITPPVTFSETAHYAGFGNAHNLVINEDSGYAYGVGTSTCSGGLHMIDIQDPANPTNAGCFSSDGYTHDAQCVMYHGPDTNYEGHEICFNANEDTLTIVDVTDKANPQQLARMGYAGEGYTHQGWLTADQHYFLLDDELDETSFGHNTRTRIWDVTDLTEPVIVDFHDGRTPAIDHNQYVHNGYTYQANYRSGLDILSARDVANGNLSEVGYFDIYPTSDSANFNGAWSTFPYYESGVVIISGIEQGLYIVQPRMLQLDKSVTGTAAPGQTITYTVAVHNPSLVAATGVVVTDTLNSNTVILSGPDTLDPGETGEYTLAYDVQEADCETGLSNTAEASADNMPLVWMDEPLFTEVESCAILEIAKGQPDGSVLPGETITYTITVTNSGVTTATGVVVTDTLNLVATVLSGPTEIAAGDSADYLFTYVVQETDCPTGLSNMASASAANAEPVELADPVITPVAGCGTESKLYLPIIVASP